MSMTEELTGCVWEREVTRLVERWEETACHLEPYAPGASAAYRRAGAELRAGLGRSAQVADSLEALCGKLADASRTAILDAIAEHRRKKAAEVS